MSPLKIELMGANGRMGHAIRAIVAHESAFTLPDNASDPADVMIDFTSPEGFLEALRKACTAKRPFVSGTTGLTVMHHNALKDASASIPVIWSPNMSLGIAILNQLSGDAARLLHAFDCTIFEAHHRHKKDAPSGTALALGKTIADARGILPDQIDYSVMRGGGIVGDHRVIFTAQEEMLTLEHRALDRAVFARGALHAAAWIVKQKPGLYTMDDLVYSLSNK